MMRLALFGGALLLAACGQKTEAPAEAPAEPAPIVAPDASAGQSVAYKCDGAGDLQITAVYGTNAEGKSDVALFIRGQDFALTETMSASGARYAGADGLEPGKGLVWWTKGETAMLQEAPSDQVDDPAAAETIRNCTVQK